MQTMSTGGKVVKPNRARRAAHAPVVWSASINPYETLAIFGERVWPKANNKHSSLGGARPLRACCLPRTHLLLKV